MSKFVMECPSCGRYVEASSGVLGFFATKKINCHCGYVINVETDKMVSKKCPHCGNMVVFDQSKGENAVCPVCHEAINTLNMKTNIVEFSCPSCSCHLSTDKNAVKYICPLCETEIDVQNQLEKEKIKSAGLASVIKYEGDKDTLVWKHPIEDFNVGSQLIVHESQEAIFFRNGQALDTFGAGRYTLETQQLPILEKIYHLPTDSTATFHSEIYYFNLSNQMALKWGTNDKVRLVDPISKAPMEIGARGLLNFRIENSRKLLLKLVGTGRGLTREDILGTGNRESKNYFRSVVQTIVSTCLAEIIQKDSIDIIEIDAQRLQLSSSLMEKVAPAFHDYGLEITEFLVEGITLPERGELGYDALQTIIKLHQAHLEKQVISVRTDIKMTEADAQKQLEIQKHQNAAEIEVARRGAVSARGETEILQTQIEGQKQVTATTADVTAERMRMQLELERKAEEARIEVEKMRGMGYTQKDVLAADVQKAYAEGIGNMGPEIQTGGGSGGSSFIGDMLGLGVGMAAAKAISPQISSMMGSFSENVTQNAQPIQGSVDDGWTCSCGKTGITTNFCPNCGNKKPEPKMAGWRCPDCGTTDITSNFCPNCGKKKPEENEGWDCPNCGTKKITFNFCPNCGTKKPQQERTWDCPNCGMKKIEFNFCPNCGNKRM